MKVLREALAKESDIVRIGRVSFQSALSDFVDYLVWQGVEEATDDEGFHEYRPGLYYPHLLGMCPRRIFYVYQTGEVLDEAGKRVVTAGHIYHRFIQTSLEKHGYQSEVVFEYPVFEGAVLKGMVDSFFPGSDSLPPHVVEIKSVRRLPSVPWPHHLFQVNAYMRAMGVDRAVLYYVSRSSFRVKTFEVGFSDVIWSLAVDWIRQLHSALLSDTPPPPDPLYSWECAKCPVAGSCPYSRMYSVFDFESNGDP